MRVVKLAAGEAILIDAPSGPVIIAETNGNLAATALGTAEAAPQIAAALAKVKPRKTPAATPTNRAARRRKAARK